jgi:hypothetical protein
MGVVTFKTSGDFSSTEKYLKSLKNLTKIKGVLDAGGRAGVRALAAATPVESGLAAESWTYQISGGPGGYRITWMNTDIENGFPVAIMLQYGYGTGTGGYVQGRDYINPAMKPIFDKIANDVWKAVTSA